MLLPLSGQVYLRQTFGRYACDPRTAKGEVLEKILMVGAIPENGGVSSADRMHLRQCLLDLRAANVNVSPDFEVSVANIDPRFGGEDFLKGGHKADVVALCYVFNPPFRGHGENTRYGTLAVSPDHFQDRAWHDAAINSGARAVWTMGDILEINASHFLVDNGRLQLAARGETRLKETAVLLQDKYAMRMALR